MNPLSVVVIAGVVAAYFGVVSPAVRTLAARRGSRAAGWVVTIATVAAASIVLGIAWRPYAGWLSAFGLDVPLTVAVVWSGIALGCMTRARLNGDGELLLLSRRWLLLAGGALVLGLAARFLVAVAGAQ